MLTEKFVLLSYYYAAKDKASCVLQQNIYKDLGRKLFRGFSIQSNDHKNKNDIGDPGSQCWGEVPFG